MCITVNFDGLNSIFQAFSLGLKMLKILWCIHVAGEYDFENAR